ncbi:MAG: ABC transporter permease [Bacteroidota bacterium]
MTVSNVLGVLKTAYRCQVQEFRLRPHYCYTIVGQPVLYMAFSVLLFRHTGRSQQIPYYLISASLIGVWNANLFTSATIVERERRDGTLLFIVASPTDVVWVLLGRSLANSTLSLTSVVASFSIAVKIAGGVATVKDFPLILGCLFLTVIAVTVLGLWVGCMFVLFREAQRLAVLLCWPVYILSGVMLPRTSLPPVCRVVGYALAPTWGLRGLQSCIGGQNSVSFVEVAAALCALTCLYFVCAYRSYNLVVRRIQKEGRMAEW